jgi:acyl-CoA synthetase (AMP-forming)/AMP-acid ligase II
MNFASGLRRLAGLERSNGSSTPFVALCCPNRIEWLVADVGCIYAGLTTVTIHYTFPEEDTDFVVEQASLEAVITSSSFIPQVRFSTIMGSSSILDFVSMLDSDDKRDGLTVWPVGNEAFVVEAHYPT